MNKTPKMSGLNQHKEENVGLVSNLRLFAFLFFFFFFFFFWLYLKNIDSCSSV